MVLKPKIVKSKIPKNVRVLGSIASGQLCVFGKLLEVGQAFEILEKKEYSKLPVYGYVLIEHQKIWYCKYSCIDNDDSYK